MRKLTLGVVIVGAGLLASLPFRRFEPIEDASNGLLEQASGPTQSELSGTSLEMLVEEVKADADARTVLGSRPIFQEPNPARRRVHTPLTYEDLAVPLTENPIYNQKFNATVEVNRSRDERKRGLPLQGDQARFQTDMPQRFADATADHSPRSDAGGKIPVGSEIIGSNRERSILTPPPKRQRSTSILENNAPGKENNAPGKLASVVHSADESQNPGSQAPLLPSGEAKDRPRHWIRQPEK